MSAILAPAALRQRPIFSAAGYQGYYSVELFSSHYEAMDAQFVANRAFQSISKYFS
jgi:hypothetical protein